MAGCLSFFDSFCSFESSTFSLNLKPTFTLFLCFKKKKIYGSVPPECANQPEVKVRSLPVKTGPVEEPLSLGVNEDGAITASGGNPPGIDADDWDPVTGEQLSSSPSKSSKKLSSGAVAGIVVGVVAAFLAAVAAAAVSRKRRARAGAAVLAAARAGTSSSR